MSSASSTADSDGEGQRRRRHEPEDVTTVPSNNEFINLLGPEPVARGDEVTAPQVRPMDRAKSLEPVLAGPVDEIVGEDTLIDVFGGRRVKFDTALKHVATYADGAPANAPWRGEGSTLDEGIKLEGEPPKFACDVFRIALGGFTTGPESEDATRLMPRFAAGAAVQEPR